MRDGEPVTRAAVRAGAEGWAVDPSTVEELVHEGFNGDPVSGGWAFACDRGVYVGGIDGATSWSVEPGSQSGRLAHVERFWAAARHRNRPLDREALSPLHRAALDALLAGVASVGDLPEDARAGLAPSARRGRSRADQGVDTGAGGAAEPADPIARADYLLVHLARRAAEPTEAAALKALAANDWLLKVPEVHHQAHRCPICGRPAIGGPRYPTAVCDACYRQTTCSHGRRISGYNASMSGGFEARHVDDEGVCEQATADHRCWIGDRECRIAEAYMGGIVVSA